jgi:serine protease
MSFSPATVALNATGGSTTATFHVTDVGIGIGGGLSSFRVFLKGPTGVQAQCSGGNTLVGGTANDGTWTCSISIPAGSAPGQWAFTQWDGFDAAGNTRVVSGSEASALSAGIAVTSTAAPDTDAPRLVSISFLPANIDLKGGSGSTTATFHVTDVGTGIGGGGLSTFRVFLKGPTGVQAQCSGGSTLVSGTMNDGTWSCSIPIVAGSASGQWVFRQWDGFDAAGNTSVVSGSDASALSSGITVTNTP